MAKGSLEAAVWDGRSQTKGRAAFKTHWGAFRDENRVRPSRSALKESLDELAAAVQKELAAGYQRIKIKIKPGKDLDPVRRLRQDFSRASNCWSTPTPPTR